MAVFSQMLHVPCREPWVATNVEIHRGDQLIFEACGVWVDAFIPCTADGYAAALLYAIDRPPRVPDGNRYFRLMGRIVEDGKPPIADDAAKTFPIGRSAKLRADRAGLLFVFANDRAGYYWNNFGQVRLTIQRIQA